MYCLQYSFHVANIITCQRSYFRIIFVRPSVCLSVSNSLYDNITYKRASSISILYNVLNPQACWSCYKRHNYISRFCFYIDYQILPILSFWDSITHFVRLSIHDFFYTFLLMDVAILVIILLLSLCAQIQFCIKRPKLYGIYMYVYRRFPSYCVWTTK